MFSPRIFDGYMNKALKQLISDVQHNCHISDAKFAGNYTLCVYLLKMREYYRWEKNSGFCLPLAQDEIGSWLTQREALWDNIEQEEYKALNIGGQAFNPFHSDAINEALKPSGLIYSGGYGVKSKPHFFIAEQEQLQKHLDYTIYISNKEYARDLTSPPAMSHNKTIYIRRESFKRLIWERTEEWRWNKPDNAMAKAIACYDFDNHLDDALNSMTDNELNNAILHEIGEIQAGEQLPNWQDMMNSISFTQAEIMARAVRDHLADALSTLPKLFGDSTRQSARQNTQQASIHFYFANLTNMRKHLFPALFNAYQQWLKDDDIETLYETASRGKQHWQTLANEILRLFNTQNLKTEKTDSHHLANNIETLVSNNHL